MQIPKRYLNQLIKRQFPSYFQSEYSTLTTFISRYYEFLDEYNLKLEDVKDIDTTTELFINHLKSEYALNLPTNKVVDDKYILSHIKDLYLHKGSKSSYDLLFRILFGVAPIIYYPSEQILRTSDGKWVQENSIFVRVDVGNVYTLINSDVVIFTEQKTIKCKVTNVTDTYMMISGNKVKNPNLFELTIDQRLTTLKYNDLVIKDNAFRGRIENTIKSVNIVDGGKGFKVGDIFEINNGDNLGTSIQITKVDDIGKILKVKLIKFGAGYSIDFLYNIGNTNIIGETTASEGDITILPEGLEIRDRVGLTESGYIVKHTYTTGNYMNGTYVGEVIGSFGTGSVTTTTENRASLLFTIGSIAKYPGYYLDNKGFLSDSIKLQDSKYYQVYSYVIKIDKAINEYADVVRNLVHPAGLALFAEYDINNSFDISNDLEFQMAYIRVNLTTITSILDDQQIGSTKILGSHVMYDGTQDNNKVEINDSLTYVKENISEGSIYNVTIQDTINLVNDGNVYNDPYIEDDYIENGYILDGYSNGYVQGEDAYVEDNSRPIQN